MPEKRTYQQCSKTVLDTNDDPNIIFDAEGVCHYVYEYEQSEAKKVVKGTEGLAQLQRLVDKIKADGKDKKYDCITGVSGGVDSTYLAYKAKEYGLRPLIVHFDNGWNSELAVQNIENIISRLGFNLFTYVINWQEFKDLQTAFFKANVIDIEALTDHAISATLYKMAAEHNIKYILSGNNIVTEGILPPNWVFKDERNIKDIHKQFGSVPLKTFPFMSPKQKSYYHNVKGIEIIEPLNYLPYNKKEVKQVIISELGWRDYGGKHYESIFTRFYQGYILPHKFKVDKRKAHLSTLICSGQMTRDEVLEELKKPIYDAEQCKIDKEFFLKKMGFTEQDFDQYIQTPPRDHKAFDHYKSFFNQYKFLKPFEKTIRKITQILKLKYDVSH